MEDVVDDTCLPESPTTSHVDAPPSGVADRRGCIGRQASHSTKTHKSGLLAFSGLKFGSMQPSLFDDAPDAAALSSVKPKQKRKARNKGGEKSVDGQQGLFAELQTDPPPPRVKPCKYDPEKWFTPERYREAQKICVTCPIQKDCAADALDFNQNSSYKVVGVWGGVAFYEDEPKAPYRRKLVNLEIVATGGKLSGRRLGRPRAAVA